MNRIRNCPYCGYLEIVGHEDGTMTCVKCRHRYEITLIKDHDPTYEHERWVPIKGYEDAYEISNYLRVRRIEHENALNRLLKEQMLSVYSKNAELYVNLYKDGRGKEHNVKKLYRNSVR